MLEPLPKTQEGLLAFCKRHEHQLWFRRLLVYVPLMAPASVFSPAWVVRFFGVGFSFWDAVTSGACVWLILGLVYVFSGADSFFHFLDIWLMWCAAIYLIGLLVCLYRCVRPSFPWQPKMVKAQEIANVPEVVLTRPHSALLEWKLGEDKSSRWACFGIQLETEGYYAFEIVVENPASPVYASMDTSHLGCYHDMEETTELRSVHRFYGRFSAGVYTFFLCMAGTTEEPEATLTQLPCGL